MSKLPLSSEPVSRLNELLQDVNFGMLTTVEQDGNLRSRPMTSQQIAFDGDLWFFTKLGSSLVDDIRANPHVNVALAAPNKNRYVSASGEAKIVQDHWRMEELWNPSYKTWFPQGLDEPELVLLRVIVCHAEFWDPSKSCMVRLIGSSRSG